MVPIGATDLMQWLYQHAYGPGADGVCDLEQWAALLAARPASLNVTAQGGVSPLHLAMRELHPAVSEATQAGIITALLDHGACLYLADDAGRTPLTQLDGPQLEWVLGVVLQHRMDLEPEIPSAAPVSASRMLKGGLAGAQALFSRVCEHVLYFLNEGGVWVWDIASEEEYQVYVPGEEFTDLTLLRARYGIAKARRSVAEYHKQSGEEVRKLYAEEQELEAQIADFEKDVIRVQAFRNFAAPVKRHQEGLPRKEWLLCNTGLLVEVTISSSGLILPSQQPAPVPDAQGGLGAAAEAVQFVPTDFFAATPADLSLSLKGEASMRPVITSPKNRQVGLDLLEDSHNRPPERGVSTAIHMSMHRGSRAGSALARRSTEARSRSSLSPSAMDKPRPLTAAAPGVSPMASDCGPVLVSPNVFTPSFASAQTPAAEALTGSPNYKRRGSVADRSVAGSQAGERRTSQDRCERRSVDGGAGWRLDRKASFPASVLERELEAKQNSGGPSAYERKQSFSAIVPLDRRHSGDRFNAPGGRRQSAAFGSGRRQSVKMAKKETEMVYVVGERGFNAGCYCDASLGVVLTCTAQQLNRRDSDPPTAQEAPTYLSVHVYRLPLGAKSRFDDIIVNVMNPEWVDSECAHSSYTFDQPGPKVLGIEKCGKARYICFTSAYPVVYDLKGDRFHSLKDSLGPSGPVHAGHALDNQPFRIIHPGCSRHAFAQVSQVVELCELREDCSVRLLYRVPRDRHEDQKYQVVFHPSNDCVAILRAGRSQELCVIDLQTHTARSLCRLPRPSTLVFHGGQLGNKVPDFCMCFSRSGKYLLRYNTSMHVLSVYEWDEVFMDATEAGYRNVTFCRAPVEPKPPPPPGASQSAPMMQAPSTGFSAVAVCDVASRTRRALGELWEPAVAVARGVLRRASRLQHGEPCRAAGEDRKSTLGSFHFASPLAALNFATSAQFALYANAAWDPKLLKHPAGAEEPHAHRGLRVRIALIFAHAVEMPGGSVLHVPPCVELAPVMLRRCPAGCIAATDNERRVVAPWRVHARDAELLLLPVAEQCAGIHKLHEDAQPVRLWLLAPDALSARLPNTRPRPDAPIRALESAHRLL
eukprot:TRINITY_DN23214_c0_g1_i1.p1 TRINITY_DN23214_c0_g1~~TRINITY_DN23214_c0_g1_i1.p1  ORF type:complete len:1133 (+),score=302.03 TRINITY_DN23214_c0_g1_i1:103-3399(+)